MHEFDCHDTVKVNGEVGEIVGTFAADNYLVRLKDGREINSYQLPVELVKRENWFIGRLRCLWGDHRMHYGFGSNVSGKCRRCGHSDGGDWS